MPYVFKTLFSHEPIVFEDVRETKSVTTAMYIDMNENLPDVSSLEVELTKLNKQVRDPKSKMNNISDRHQFEKEMALTVCRIHELEDLVSHGHNYVFVGRTGLFCPMKDGYGAGILVRENKDKFDSAPNSSGTRWMEAEMVRMLEKEDGINIKWFDELCDEAINDISEFGDYYWFVSEEEYKSPPALLGEPLTIESDDLPF